MLKPEKARVLQCPILERGGGYPNSVLEIVRGMNGCKRMVHYALCAMCRHVVCVMRCALYVVCVMCWVDISLCSTYEQPDGRSVAVEHIGPDNHGTCLHHKEVERSGVLPRDANRSKGLVMLLVIGGVPCSVI